MKRPQLLSSLWVLLFLTSGCSTIHKAEEGVADAEQGIADTPVYPIDRTTAEDVILSAFQEGWPNKEATPLGEGRIGYEITLHFAIDRERVIAEAIKSGSGYLFRVTNRGTAPVVGVPARKKLVSLLHEHAAK